MFSVVDHGAFGPRVGAGETRGSGGYEYDERAVAGGFSANARRANERSKNDRAKADDGGDAEEFVCACGFVIGVGAGWCVDDAI